MGSPLLLARAYVGLRVLHGLVQDTRNIDRCRLLLFALGTVALIGLTAQAALAVS